MAFNEYENRIIQWGQENGKSVDEIRNAIVQYRTKGVSVGLQPQEITQELVPQITPTTPTRPSFIEQQKEILTGEERTGRVQEILQAYQQEEQGLPSTAFQLGGEAIRGGFESFASLPVVKQGFDILSKGIVGLSKISPVQKAGEVIEPITSEVVDFYNSLTPEQQRNVNAAVEFAAVIPVGRTARTALRGTAEAIGTTAETLVSAGAKALTKGTEFLGGITETGARGIKAATESALNPINIMQRVARISKSRQVAFQELTGESVGEYLVNRGMFGNVDNLIDQLFKRFNDSRKAVDTTFAKIKGNFKNTSVGNALKQLVERERAVSTPGAVSKDLDRIIELQKKHNGIGLTMSEVNEVKRLYERKVKLDYAKEINARGVEVANNVDSAMRGWQRSVAADYGFTDLAALNQETQSAKQLLDALGFEYAGTAGNNLIGLTDWIILAGGEPSSLAGFITKKIFSSQTIMAKIAQQIAKLTGVTPKELPKPQITGKPVDGFAEFIRTIEGRTTQ